MKYSMHSQYYDGSLPASVCTMAEDYSNAGIGYCIGGQSVEACVPRSGVYIHGKTHITQLDRFH